MSLHETISADIHAIIEDQGGVASISPTTVALALTAKYATQRLDPPIHYASLEHFKQMARKALSGRFGTESDDAQAYQAELFSGHLQVRYPTPHKRGEDPVYKLLEALTDDDVAWNLQALQRSAKARLLHADALRAWHQSRKQAA